MANASFLMNRLTLRDVMNLRDSQDRHLFVPSLTARTLSTLLGFPVFLDPNMPVPAANSLSILFGDFRAYTVVERQGTRIMRDPFTSKPNVLFYATRRIGGDLVNGRALMILKLDTV